VPLWGQAQSGNIDQLQSIFNNLPADQQQQLPQQRLQQLQQQSGSGATGAQSTPLEQNGARNQVQAIPQARRREDIRAEGDGSLAENPRLKARDTILVDIAINLAKNTELPTPEEINRLQRLVDLIRSSPALFAALRAHKNA
jgi:hypothetical protein